MLHRICSLRDYFIQYTSGFNIFKILTHHLILVFQLLNENMFMFVIGVNTKTLVDNNNYYKFN